MKKAYLILITTLITACEKAEIEPVKEITDGFCIVVQEEVVLNHHDIKFYDVSENKIYLKTTNPFAENSISGNEFTVYADKGSVYSGYLLSMFSSFLPTGPVIYIGSAFKKDSTVQIGCAYIKDEMGNINSDPRNDSKIIEALKKYDQFQE